MGYNIKLFKLVNGDAVLTKFERTENGDYLFLSPVVVFPVSQGQIGVQPWLGGQDMTQPVEVKQQHVVAIGFVDDDLLKGYNEKYHGVPAIQLASAADAQALKQAESKIIQ